MAERQRRIELSKPIDVTRLREGVPLSLSPTGVMQELILIESHEVIDRVAFYAQSFRINTAAGPFPILVTWSLRAGINCEFDDALPVADVFTNLLDITDLSTRRGYLLRHRGVQANTFALMGMLPVAVGQTLTFSIKGLVDAGGNMFDNTSVGSAVG